MEKINIRGKIADAILNKPWGFKVGGQQFFMYPATLGQYLMTISVLEEMEIQIEDFARNAIDVSLFMAKTKREQCLKILAINLMTAKDVQKESNIDKYAKKIDPLLDNGDVATLLIAAMTYSQERINLFVNESGLNRDKNDLKKINAVKKGKNSFTFGGRTIYGQLIDAACERYGWTLDYILWGISYINLNMLLGDQLNTVFISDNELKHVHISNDRDVINGDDPKNIKKIMEQFNG